MIAASVDRLGRSLQDLVGFLTELQALRCDLYLHQQALDTSTPCGRAMFQMCGIFAEFERAMIRERVNAGLARAKEKGVKLGRRAVKRAVEDRIRALRAEGMGILKVVRKGPRQRITNNYASDSIFTKTSPAMISGSPRLRSSRLA